MSTKKAAAPQAAKRPAKAPKSTRRTEGQRLYDEVAELERKLKGLMDEIPRFMLRGRRQGWETCNDRSEERRVGKECIYRW